MRWSPGQPVILETTSYLLRSLKKSDATARYRTWLRDAEVTRYLQSDLSKSTIKSIREYIDHFNNQDSFLLGIFTKGEQLHVGNLTAECDLYHGTAALGAMVGDRNFWGNRVIIETRAALLDFLFGEVGMTKVFGGPLSTNLPAIYNYKAQGFTVEGVLKSYFVNQGKRVDWIAFGMLRDDWRAKNDSNVR